MNEEYRQKELEFAQRDDSLCEGIVQICAIAPGALPESSATGCASMIPTPSERRNRDAGCRIADISQDHSGDRGQIPAGRDARAGDPGPGAEWHVPLLQSG